MQKNKFKSALMATAFLGGLLTAPAYATKPQGKDVDGYRSAQFGMTQKQVRDAIKKDFNLNNDQIESGKNLITRTQSLSVKVNDLLPDTGEGHVSYIFGYNSEALIQVNVTWQESQETDLTAEKILGIGGSLQNYFLSQPYDFKNVVTGVKTAPDTLILFRAEDADNDLLLLLVEGLKAQGQETEAETKPLTLKLSYQHNSDKPDIYQIPSGAF